MPSDFINGRFVEPVTADGVIELRSPADQADVVGRHAWALSHVDDAVMAARAAFPSWRRLGQPARAALLRAYQAQLKAHADALARCIAREIGKPLWEAKTEVGAMVSKVDVSLGEGAAFVKDVTIADLPGEIRHRPHGVAAVIGPFNFPGHLPNGQLVPALLTGNTVVFKPSDKGPGTAALMAKCFEAAGFPAGVFNLVQGAVPTAEKLVSHPGIDALLFTGSVPVGQRIVAANAHRPGLLVALELGGKNATVVLDDCDLERTVRELAFSGFATAGQRCTATSRVVVTRGIAPRLIEGLAAAARSVVVGHVFDEGVFMGPVISEQTRAQLLAAQQKAVAAGFEPVVPGGAVEVPGRRGFYVRPAVHVARGGVVRAAGYTDTELFAPDLAVITVDSLEQAVEVANETEFGLSAAVFTEAAAAFERCADELRVGVLHWNRSSAGASGRLPFGGIRASGNHRPAGIVMGQACTYPLAVLLPQQAGAPLPTWPGLSF
ncbi:MAG: aldehyde dehydrogenase family protein [Myxococcus sp.]|nr:aldehyde dehydrogenase family protein [Myxococcus sp.]